MHVTLTTAKVAMSFGTALAVVSATGAAAAGAAQPVATTASSWSQTDYNAAQSRANLAERTLTRSTVSKIVFLRSVTAPPLPVNGCGQGVAAPVLTGGSLYAVTSGYLTKYNPATGRIIWRRNPDPSFLTFYTSLAVAGGLVVVGGVGCDSVSDPNGFIQAFDAATGALVWSQGNPDGGALAQLVVSNGFVVAAGTSAGGGEPVFVLRLTDGALVWHRLTSPCLSGDVLVDAQVVIAYSCTEAGGERLVGSKLATGARLWSRSGSWQLQRGDTDTTAGRHVFATSPGGTVVSLNPLTGQTQYSLAQATDVLAVGGPQVYASCGLGVCAYSTATGSLRWQAQLGLTVALAAAAGGVLYTDWGFALDAGNGQTLATLWQDNPATWLAVGGGRIAVVTGPRVVDLYGLPGS